jgi:hypothetical protein
MVAISYDEPLDMGYERKSAAILFSNDEEIFMVTDHPCGG